MWRFLFLLYPGLRSAQEDLGRAAQGNGRAARSTHRGHGIFNSVENDVNAVLFKTL